MSVLPPQREEHGESMPAQSAPGEATIAAGHQQAPAGKEDNTWELCKENVMPMRRGRKVKSIRRAFGAPVPADEEDDEEAAGYATGADPKTVLSAIRRWVHAALHSVLAWVVWA